MLDEHLDRWKYPPLTVGDPAQPHSAYVIIHGPGHNGTVLVLREGITSFGRLPSNDVILLGDLVSRHHTRITFFEGRATLQDLGSHNGSWVNGEKVSTRVLKEGDVARVGNFRLAFHPGLPPEQGSGSFEETTAAEESRRSGSRRLEAMVVGPTPMAARRGLSQGNSRSAILDQLELARSGTDVQTRALHLLIRATDALSKSPDLDSYLASMLTLAIEQTSAEVAAYVEVSDGSINVVAARGPKGPITDPPIAASVINWVISKNFEVMSEDVGKDLRFVNAGKQTGGKNAVICAAVTTGERAQGALYVARVRPFGEEDLDVVTAVAHLAGNGLARSRGSSSQGTIDRLVAPELRAQFGAGEIALDSGSATMLSADVPGLSAMAERLDPGDATRTLSAVFTTASELATRHRGVLLPTGGTEIRILYSGGSPAQNAARAVATAIELRSATDPVLQRLPAEVARRIRVGIASGWLLAGFIGNNNRATYTVIGDTVETAAQAQALAQPGSVLLAEATYVQVQEQFEARRIQTQGMADALSLFELIGKKGPAGRARAG
jgi:adenylate cyclase